MLSSFFDSRPRRKRDRADRSPFASSYGRTATPPRYTGPQHDRRRSLRYEDEDEDEDSESTHSEEEHGERETAREQQSDEDGSDAEENAPLLPLFDSARLDALPIYTLTHTFRLLVCAKIETVLTWEQLRSPQVSQFLLKPIQTEIRANYFSAATIYCLMANCLQFAKEMAMYPANSGTLSTRAMVCELIAIKLLREYTTRGLIDALSYDFDPLQGQAEAKPTSSANHRPNWQNAARKGQPRPARISCFEIAIRAQAKRFLAHPVIVQQLEAIWDGSIVFHAAADNMHRSGQNFNHVDYGTSERSQSQHASTEGKHRNHAAMRKVVTLYNPRDASIFKLSRLRVPRYRNVLSTISFAILLGLFVGVLSQRSVQITALEVIFWVWAGGFMADEIVGVSEQGFGLYIASFWNTMDVGIVLLLVLHLVLRIYGIIMPDVRRQHIATMAFDLLATDAILLFPRLFSILDHYRYFSQLIIAFRLMVADLVAVFVLIVIACSGFFVALTFSFGYGPTDSASEVAYALLQMVMGFTPAVWDRWEAYTPLGRAVLVGFLGMCHFLVLTILITVLTNSFMAVVKNANEEHQFIFAVNTISSVKSDALFSYVPPFNVLGWMLHPTRYTLPFRQYIKLNRTVIKVTHFPILFFIYAYEKVILQPRVVDRIDVVEHRKGSKSTFRQRLPRLVRAPSIATFRQDQALEEVFKQPFNATLRTEILHQRKSSTVVNKWMHEMVEEPGAPQEDDPKTVDRLEGRRLRDRNVSGLSRFHRSARRPQSVVSDPADLASHMDFFSPIVRIVSGASRTPSHVELDPQEDNNEGDGDDEMQTIDNDDDRLTNDDRQARPLQAVPGIDYFAPRMMTPIRRTPFRTGSTGSDSRAGRDYRGSAPGQASPSKASTHVRPHHTRNVSTATMIFSPAAEETTNDELPRPPTAIQSRPITPGSKQTSSGTGKKTPKPRQQARMRPTFPGKENAAFRSVPDISVLRPVPQNPRRSSLEMDLVSDIGDNKAIGGGYIGALPASFATQLAMASGGLKLQQERKEEQERFGRLMMARMNTLEEGFREVIHEMRENMKAGSRTRSPERPAQVRRERRAATKDTKGKEKAVPSLKDVDSGSSTVLEPKQTSMSVATVVPDEDYIADSPLMINSPRTFQGADLGEQIENREG